MNYVSTNGCLPSGSYAAIRDDNTRIKPGLSVLVRVMPFVEGQASFNASNFSFCMDALANATVAAIGISTLWCPSDPLVANGTNPLDSAYHMPNPGNFSQYYTSYGGNQGLWDLDVSWSDDANWYAGAYAARKANMYGVIFMSSNVKLSEITDGTSNTMLFAERAHGRLPAATPPSYYHWWNSGYYTDALICTYFPINGDRSPVLQNNIVNGSGDYYEEVAETVGSFHPGGANVGFCDGSVRFVKDSIQSLLINPTAGTNDALIYNGNTGTWSMAPGTRLGVWQALSTRGFGEVLSSDSY
jgi:prepilin-type processing-associated H-X9-DG protein